MRELTKKNIILQALQDSFPIMASYTFLGMGFGILLSAKGYGVIWATVSAIFLFAGTLQYAEAAIIGSGLGLTGIVITSLAIQIRHLFYCITMLDKFKQIPSKLNRFALFWMLTDENFSLLCNSYLTRNYGEGMNKNKILFYTLVSAFNYSYWIIGCTLGALLGNTLNLDIVGMDFIMTAFFVSVFTEQWITSKNHLAAIIGFVATGISLFFIGSENFLIPAMIAIVILLTIFRKKEGITNE